MAVLLALHDQLGERIHPRHEDAQVVQDGKLDGRHGSAWLELDPRAGGVGRRGLRVLERAVIEVGAGCGRGRAGRRVVEVQGADDAAAAVRRVGAAAGGVVAGRHDWVWKVGGVAVVGGDAVVG